MKNIIILEEDMMLGEKPPIEPVNDVWICGGAIRRWFNKEPTYDVDVFAPKEENLNEYLTHLENKYELKKLNDNKNAATYKTETGVIIQLIKFHYPTIEELFENFDFNICQFAWDGKNIYTTTEAVLGVFRKRLAVVKITEPLDTLRRAFKYQRKGYTPCVGTLRDLGISFTEKTIEQINEMTEISPGGGKRIIRFD